MNSQLIQYFLAMHPGLSKPSKDRHPRSSTWHKPHPPRPGKTPLPLEACVCSEPSIMFHIPWPVATLIPSTSHPTPCNVASCLSHLLRSHTSSSPWTEKVSSAYGHGLRLHVVVAVGGCQLHEDGAHLGLHIEALDQLLLQQGQQSCLARFSYLGRNKHVNMARAQYDETLRHEVHKSANSSSNQRFTTGTALQIKTAGCSAKTELGRLCHNRSRGTEKPLLAKRSPSDKLLGAAWKAGRGAAAVGTVCCGT